MCEDQRTLRHLVLRLDDAHINVLLPEIRSNILPSRTFLGSLSLIENVSTAKRACLIVFTLARHIILKGWLSFWTSWLATALF